MSKYRIIRGNRHHYIQKKFLWLWRDVKFLAINGDIYFNEFKSIDDAIDVLSQMKNRSKHLEDKKEPCVVWAIEF